MKAKSAPSILIGVLWGVTISPKTFIHHRGKNSNSAAEKCGECHWTNESKLISPVIRHIDFMCFLIWQIRSAHYFWGIHAKNAYHNLITRKPTQIKKYATKTGQSSSKDLRLFKYSSTGERLKWGPSNHGIPTKKNEWTIDKWQQLGWISRELCSVEKKKRNLQRFYTVRCYLYATLEKTKL